MKNARGVLVTCLAGFVVASLAVAQEGGGGPGGQRPAGAGESGGAMWGGLTQVEGTGFRAGMALEQILDDPDKTQKVGLSDEQIKTLRTIISDSKKEQIRLKAEMDIAAVDQADKMVQTNLDEKEIMKTVEKVGNLRTQLAKSWIKQLILVKKTLTPEQFKKVHEVAREAYKQRMNEAGKEKKKEEAKERRKEASKEDKSGDQKDKDKTTTPPPEDVKQ